jgi:hypothetical protein
VTLSGRVRSYVDTWDLGYIAYLTALDDVNRVRLKEYMFYGLIWEGQERLHDQLARFEV